MNIVKRVRKHTNGNALTKSQSDFWPAFNREGSLVLNHLRRFLEEPLSIASDLLPWPAIDMKEDDKAITLRVDVPGINPKDITVDVSGNLLTLGGSRQDEKKSEKGGILRQERHEGSFLRTITLPSYVDPTKIEAKCEKGVLTVTATKVPGAGPKRVPVKAQ